MRINCILVKRTKEESQVDGTLFLKLEFSLYAMKAWRQSLKRGGGRVVYHNAHYSAICSQLGVDFYPIAFDNYTSNANEREKDFIA